MTTSTETMTAQEELEFLADLEQSYLAPVWRLLTQTREPKTAVQPFIWRWRDTYPRLMRCGDLMRPSAVQSDGPAERRALLLVNPGHQQAAAATNTIVAGIQLIFPGEVAPAHRHAPAAVRLMVQGSGAYTTVEGEKVRMEPGDLVLTPSWTWHDHGNESTEPIVWIDGLDRFLIQSLNAGFFEPDPNGKQEPTKPPDYSLQKYGATHVRPTWEPLSTAATSSPQRCYKWRETALSLRRLADLGETGPYGEVAVAYVNPITGGHVTSTLGCAAELIRPGSRTKARRHTGSIFYHVMAGGGSTVINGKRFRWEKGDCFTVPPWAWYEHDNRSATEESFLFCLSDLPVFHALGLYREQAYEANGGYQEVTSTD